MSIRGSEQEAALEALTTIRARVDAHFDAAIKRSPQAMRCAQGCEQCCHVRISVFSIEAAPIQEALAQLAQQDPKLRARIRDQADAPEHADRCALLVDGRCSVYEERPLICRSHGVPVLTSREETEAECCPLNFRSGAEVPPPASVLQLEAINRPLAVMASLWDGHGDRVQLSCLARGAAR